MAWGPFNAGAGQLYELNSMINGLSAGTSTPTDADYYVSQYAGGGTTTTTYHRRPMSALWAYIKAKTDSLYAAKSHSHSAMTAASSSAAGTAGFVPAPAAGKQGQFLRGDGTWATPTNTTYGAATTSAAGLMSASDKSKLDGITAGANKYTHPSYTAKTSGLYKVTVDATGHVSAATAVAKSDITALGIPSTNTTYSAATTSAAGLMSAADKKKLDGLSSTTADLTALQAKVDAIDLKYGTNVTKNPFSVTFSTLSGSTVTGGVWNQSSARIEF